MKAKDIIITATAVAIGTAVAVGTGLIVKNQMDKHSVKPVVCNYDKSFREVSDDQIVVAMLATPNSGMEPVFASVIAIPPAKDEFKAYLSAVSVFENTNRTSGRELLSFLPIYADGHIGDNVIASERIYDECENVQNEDYMIEDFVISLSSNTEEKIKIKITSSQDVIDKQTFLNSFYDKSRFVVYDVVINNDNRSGDQRFVEKFFDQPIDIYDIYNGWNLNKINKDAYNPIKRVSLVKK